ncbi:MAG: 30S ribosomal protein S6 [Chloroflexi bacterium]|nr:30S ribosomal protein S6 [Chloroflexota bacterium]
MVRVRDYELMMVVSPQVDEEQTKVTVDRVHRLITEKGGTVVSHEPWGMRRLAFPIRRFKEGNYFLTKFKLEATGLRDLDNLLRVTEDVLRHLVVKVET